MRSSLLLLLLAGCSSTPVVVDHTRTVTVYVKVEKKLDPAFLADCQPEPLQGTTVEAALARLASVETCLSTLTGQLDKLRALQNAPAAAP